MLPLLLACLGCFQSRPADLREVLEFTVQGGSVQSVAWSPDGAWLAAGGQDGEVVLWHAGPRTEAGRIQASQLWIRELCFSADSRRLLVLGQDVSVWDVATRALVRRLPARSPRALALSPDGSRLAISLAGEKSRVTVMDAASFAELAALDCEVGTAATALAFAHDNATLVAAAESAVVAFDLRTGKSTSERDAGNPHGVVGLAFAPDGTRVVLSGSGAWQVGARRGKLERAATSLAVSRDGRQIAMAGEEGRIFLCDAAGTVVRQLDGGSRWVSCLGFAPDGQTLAAAGGDGRVLLWREGRVVAELRGMTDRPHGLAFSGDERFAVATGQETTTVELGTRAIRRYPGGGCLVSGAAGPEVLVVEEQRVRVVNAQDMSALHAIPLPVPLVPNIAALSPNGRTLVVGGGITGRNLVVDLRTQQTQLLRKDAFQFVDLAFSGDSSRFAAACMDGAGSIGKVEVWSTEAELVHRLRAGGGVESVALTSSGAELYWIEGSAGRVPGPTAGAHRIDLTTLAEAEAPKLEAMWLRFVDQDLALSHDGSAVTLRRAPRLEAIRTLRCSVISDALLSRSGRWLLLADRASIRVFRIER